MYHAANVWLCPSRDKLSLDEEIKLNETALCAISGIRIETRPDWITRKQIKWFRRLTVTLVALGIQHLDDRILNYVNRQCNTRTAIKAFRMLKRNGFKICAHFMPDLPGSSYELDRAMFEYLFSDQEDIQADYWKVYPTMTTDKTKILEWYKEGIYEPYAKKDDGKWINEVMRYVSLNTPPQIRLERLGRDIPNKYISTGLGSY